MKKCFTLTLLLMAAVVLTVSPVNATAPLISDLPRIVMADDSGSDELLNALNLDAYINWHPNGANADYTEDDFVVYLYDPSTDRELILFALTTATLEALVDSPYETPSGVLSGFGGSTTTTNWLSLTYLDHSAAGEITGDIQVIAGVVDFNGITTSSIGIMEVVTNATGGKDIVLFSRFQSADHEIDSLLAGWTNQAQQDPPGYVTITVAAGKVGYDCGTVSNPDGGLSGAGFGYGHMVSGDGAIGTFMVPHNGVDFDAANAGISNPAFSLTATLSGTAPNPENSAGYRLGFLSAANTHFGYLTFQAGTLKDPTAGYITAINTPSANTGYHQFELSWAVPTGATGMSDAQIGSYTAGGTAADGRDYGLLFDVIDLPGNFGVLALESIAIRTFSLDDVTADAGAGAQVYGTGDINTWGGSGLGLPGFGDGTGTDVGGALRLGTSGADLVLVRSNPAVTTRTDNYPAVPGALVRSTIIAKSAVVDTAPVMRMLIMVQNFTGGFVDRQQFMEEHWGSVGPTYKAIGSRPAGADNPGVPQTTDTTFTSLMRIAAPGAQDTSMSSANDVIAPQIQAYKFGLYGTAWPAQDGSIDIVSWTLDTVDE